MVKPHPHFMLFATQNPPGIYAGRKTLSRAFRSRFLELHVDDIPDGELPTILEKRCSIAPSYAEKLVKVMCELQRRRSLSNVFAGRHGFITPRDLFRWAGRGAVGYQQLAEDGFAVLGERLRSQDERQTVQEALEKLLGAKLDMQAVYYQGAEEALQQLQAVLTGAGPGGAVDAGQGATGLPGLVRALRGIVWTQPLRRMWVLLPFPHSTNHRSLGFIEPWSDERSATAGTGSSNDRCNTRSPLSSLVRLAPARPRPARWQHSFAASDYTSSTATSTPRLQISSAGTAQIGAEARLLPSCATAWRASTC